MLVSFAVENFRSIRERAELTFEPLPSLSEHEEELLHVALPKGKEAALLPIGVLYGPNASGKSTFLDALRTMYAMLFGETFTLREPRPWDLARESKRPGLPYTPFAFDEVSRSEPTTFEITFIRHGVRYDYSLSYERERVVHEELSAYPSGGRRQRRFVRTEDEVKAMNGFLFPKVVSDRLRPWDLVVTTIIQDGDRQRFEKIAPLWGFFSGIEFVRASSIDMSDEVSLPIELESGRLREAQRRQLRKLVRRADLTIEDFRVTTRHVDPLWMRQERKRTLAANPEMPEQRVSDMLRYALATVEFDHVLPNGTRATIPLEDESDGTYHFLRLAIRVISVLSTGGLLVVDELDASLHPILLREIVRCFCDPEVNPNGAQLLFSAHDVSLLDADVLRNDEVWLTWKSTEGSTQLASLADFGSLPDEMLSAGYLIGRYGAVPLIQDAFKLGPPPKLDGDELLGDDASNGSDEDHG